MRNAAGVVEINNGTAGQFKDLKLQNLRLNPQSSAPSGSEGLLYGNSTDHKVYYHNGTSFVDLTAGGAGGGSPGGSSKDFQWNNAGAFGGGTGFTYENGANTIWKFQKDQAGVTELDLKNATAGASSGAQFVLWNDAPIYGALTLTASNYTGMLGGNATALQAQQWLHLVSGQDIKFWVGGLFNSVTFTNAGGIALNTGGVAGAQVINTASNGLYEWNSDTALGRNAAGIVEVNNGTAGQWGALKAGVRDAATAVYSDGLTLGHQSTGTPAASFGSSILFNANDNGAADRNAGRIGAAWVNATDASRSSYVEVQTVNNAGALASQLRVTATGGLAVGSVAVGNADPGAGNIRATTVIHQGVTVANLPSSPVAGSVAYVTDGAASLAWGATVTGGSSTKYLVWYNGAAWTVVGK
jgi:hypothetical protein